MSAELKIVFGHSEEELKHWGLSIYLFFDLGREFEELERVKDELLIGDRGDRWSSRAKAKEGRSELKERLRVK